MKGWGEVLREVLDRGSLLRRPPIIRFREHGDEKPVK